MGYSLLAACVLGAGWGMWGIGREVVGRQARKRIERERQVELINQIPELHDLIDGIVGNIDGLIEIDKTQNECIEKLTELVRELTPPPPAEPKPSPMPPFYYGPPYEWPKEFYFTPPLTNFYFDPSDIITNDLFYLGDITATNGLCIAANSITWDMESVEIAGWKVKQATNFIMEVEGWKELEVTGDVQCPFCSKKFLNRLLGQDPMIILEYGWQHIAYCPKCARYFYPQEN